MVRDLLAGLVQREHGHAVAQQFYDTYYDDYPLEDQNKNALSYIVETLEEYTDANVLSTDSEMDLESYVERLKDYLNE